MTRGSILAMLPFAGILAIVATGQTLVIQQRGLDMSAIGMVSLAGVVMARTGIQDAQAAKATALADLGAKHAAAWGAVEADLRKGLAARGMEGAQIDSDSRVIAAKKERLQAEQAALAPTIKHVQSTVEKVKTETDPGMLKALGTKPATESQGKNAGFMEVMLNEHKTLDSLPPMSEAGRELLRWAEARGLEVPATPPAEG